MDFYPLVWGPINARIVLCHHHNNQDLEHPITLQAPSGSPFRESHTHLSTHWWAPICSLSLLFVKDLGAGNFCLCWSCPSLKPKVLPVPLLQQGKGAVDISRQCFPYWWHQCLPDALLRNCKWCPFLPTYLIGVGSLYFYESRDPFLKSRINFFKDLWPTQGLFSRIREWNIGSVPWSKIR